MGRGSREGTDGIPKDFDGVALVVSEGTPSVVSEGTLSEGSALEVPNVTSGDGKVPGIFEGSL